MYVCIDGVVDQMRTVLKSKDCQCTLSAFGALLRSRNETFVSHVIVTNRLKTPGRLGLLFYPQHTVLSCEIIGLPFL